MHLLFLIFFLLPSLVWGDSELTVGGRTAQSHLIKVSGVNMPPRPYLSVTGDSAVGSDSNGQTIITLNGGNPSLWILSGSDLQPTSTSYHVSVGTTSNFGPVTIGPAPYIYSDTSADWIVGGYLMTGGNITMNGGGILNLQNSGTNTIDMGNPTQSTISQNPFNGSLTLSNAGGTVEFTTPQIYFTDGTGGNLGATFDVETPSPSIAAVSTDTTQRTFMEFCNQNSNCGSYALFGLEGAVPSLAGGTSPYETVLASYNTGTPFLFEDDGVVSLIMTQSQLLTGNNTQLDDGAGGMDVVDHLYVNTNDGSSNAFQVQDTTGSGAFNVNNDSVSTLNNTLDNGSGDGTFVGSITTGSIINNGSIQSDFVSFSPKLYSDSVGNLTLVGLTINGLTSSTPAYINGSNQLASGSFTGTGTVFVTQASPSITTPTITTNENINNSGTTKSCATSGTVTWYPIQQGTGYKKVVGYAAACLGASASYTFPTAFAHTPAIMTTNELNSALLSTLSTTAVVMTGTTSTGYIIIEGN